MRKLISTIGVLSGVLMLLVLCSGCGSKPPIATEQPDSPKQTQKADDQTQPAQSQPDNKETEQKEERKPDQRTVVSYHPGTQVPAVVKCVSGWDSRSAWTEFFRADGTLERKEGDKGRYVFNYDPTGKHHIHRVWNREDGTVDTVLESPIGGKETRKEFRQDGSLSKFIEYPSDKLQQITAYRPDGKTVWWTEEQREVGSSLHYKSTMKLNFDHAGKPVKWTIERELAYPDRMSSNGPAKWLATETYKRVDGTVLYKLTWYYSFNRVTTNFERACSLFEEYAADGKTLVRQIKRDVSPTASGIFPVTYAMHVEEGKTTQRWCRDDETVERELIQHEDGRRQLRLYDRKDNIRPEIPALTARQFGFWW
ncbi:MAG: hypothetical protein K2W95_31565 [Candidatus Obscuribacterales bacterium]|nr:hypothetical protein [Candidatus Obscuribacterales bacterium]